MDISSMEGTGMQQEVAVTEGVDTEQGMRDEDLSVRTPDRSQRRRTWAAAAITVLVVGGAGTALLLKGSGDSTDDVSHNTAAVQRTDLVVTEELSGTLGYGAAEQVTFRSSSDGVASIPSRLNGTVTAIVSEGTVVEFGDVLYEIDGNPVVVLPGSLPPYRDFNSRMSDGPDVEQLEQALIDLGYASTSALTVDEDFTAATMDAIERLQEAIGMDQDGSLGTGEVVFVPEAFYAAAVLVDVGSTLGNGAAIVSTSRPIEGTVTSIAPEGSVVEQGETLLALDGEAVVMLIGDFPAFRAMQIGTSGADVLQLEEALAALGFGEAEDFTRDGVFDGGTRLAVLAWQEAIGAAPDGVVNVGDVIFSPTRIRVRENLVGVGDVVRDASPIMSTSVDETFVAVELSTDDLDLVAVGDAATVVLPGGGRTPATVTAIGTVARSTQNGDTYFEMTVTLDDPNAAPGLDEAPVDVEVTGDSAMNVLSVPVTALVALAEGGYAVEVINDDGTSTLIGVDPGLFADGRVEVVGGALADGMLVVVP